MLPNLTKVGIFINFTMNQDFIAKVLCINKKKPMLSCNGKCFLAQKLKKAEEKEEKQSPTPKKEQIVAQYFFSKNSFFTINQLVNHTKETLSTYTNIQYTSCFLSYIFRPPKQNLI